MQNDFKIGLILGLALAIAVVLWLSTRPSLSPEARIAHSPEAVSQEDYNQQPFSPVTTRVPTTNAETIGNLNTLAKSHDLEEPKATGQNSQEQNLPDLTVYEQAEKIKTQRFHIVLKGETLSSISKQYYGTANKWQKILDANRETIKDANKIAPGTKLIIPD